MEILIKLDGPNDRTDNFAIAGALYETCRHFEDLDPETIARMILQQCDCDRYKPNAGERIPE